jgi:hypothetical protein
VAEVVPIPRLKILILRLQLTDKIPSSLQKLLLAEVLVAEPVALVHQVVLAVVVEHTAVQAVDQ